MSVIEEGMPLERSVLWSWIRHYYSQGGMAVWNDGDVPFHITNTPALAYDWAASIIAILRDLSNAGKVDPNQPIEVFELGPGVGRHAFYLFRELKRLEPLTRSFCGRALRFRLHLAELGESGLKSLSEHPNWKTPLAEGDLVLHSFDIDNDEWPEHYSGQLTEGLLPSKNPLFMVSNYLLDSLPHDVIRVDQSRVHRAKTTVTVEGLKPGVDPTSVKNLGERINLSFTYDDQEVRYTPKYWDELIDCHRSLTTETYIPFPTSALRLLERARNWSEVATVLLAADKSFTSLHQMEDLDEPELVPHGGGFSFNANLHALGEFALRLGGFAHHTTPRDGTLDLSHLILPACETEGRSWEFIETELHLANLERFHAVDRFRIKEGLEEMAKTYSLRMCLDILRLAYFDPEIFYELSDSILVGLDDDVEEMEDLEMELAKALDRCHALIYPLCDDVDVTFEIGRIAYRLELYDKAHHAFSLSLLHYGEDARTRFNLGLTWYYRDQFELAKFEFEQALALDPDYKDARTWSKKSTKKMTHQPSPSPS